jgi:nucleotide-binding universal stress UspA family protein
MAAGRRQDVRAKESEMPAPKESGPARIVAGVDGSPSSVAALRWAVRQAGLTGGTVDAVIAWHYPPSGGGYGWAPAAVMDETKYDEIAAKSLAEAVSEAGPPAGVSIRQHVRSGLPAPVLLGAAEGADLLVVGCRGHGGFAGALLGSVSQHCVQHAPCPVVVIRGEERS